MASAPRMLETFAYHWVHNLLLCFRSRRGKYMDLMEMLKSYFEKFASMSANVRSVEPVK